MIPKVVPHVHDYKFDSFVWTGYTAQAKYVCADDNTHVVYYDATVTSEVTTAATCTTAGVRTYTATYDGHTATKTEDVKALGHDYKFVEFVWTDYTAKAKYVCTNDNTHVEYYDATVTSEVTTAATCETKGVKTYTATYDGHTATKTEDIKALGHDYQAVVTEPTCTERGYTTHTCSHCEDSYVDTYVDALGHEWGEWTVTKEAQPGVKGEETRTCSVCGEKETREIAALPYVPTINENGEKVYEITIDVATAKDVSDVFAIAKEENGSVEFTVNADFGTVTLTFDSDAVVELGDKKVSLIASVNTQDLSSFAIDGAIVAIDVTLSGATFASGNVTVSIALNTIVPKGKIVKIYYVAEDGTKTDMNATIDGGTVTFTTNHFSTYVVAVEDAPKTPVNEFIKKGCSGSISGSAIAVFGVVMAGLMIALKKKERNE